MKEELTLFPKNKLKSLILPLLFDQLFNVLVGMADTVMVSSVGEAAVSGVSLVDTLNMFFLMIFSGLATGGAIISAQLIGTKKLMKYTYYMMCLVNIPILFFAPWILKIYNLTAATGTITLNLIRYNCLCGLTI